MPHKIYVAASNGAQIKQNQGLGIKCSNLLLKRLGKESFDIQLDENFN